MALRAGDSVRRGHALDGIRVYYNCEVFTWGRWVGMVRGDMMRC